MSVQAAATGASRLAALLPVVGSGFRKKGLPLLVGDRGQTRNKGFRCGFTSLDGLVRHSRKAFELFRQRLGDEEQVAFQLKNLSAVQIHQAMAPTADCDAAQSMTADRSGDVEKRIGREDDWERVANSL
ncbi:MAG: hypothetical protein ACLUNV_01920 [Sutterella wadsworthensis]